MISRRGLLGSLLAAPAIVCIDNIMPVKNRLISSIYEGPEQIYTFSCYLKDPDAKPLFLYQTPNDARVSGLSPVGRGWYRFTAEFKDGDRITLPHSNMYSAQVNWWGPKTPAFDLEVVSPDGKGALLMPNAQRRLFPDDLL